MLQSIHQRFGEKLRASDGEIGHVRDFYFDDKTWSVRYLVADTGHWLAERLVLISPHAFGHLYPEGKVLLVNLTRKQIEDSPSIDKHQPVSRQHEEEYHRHYGYEYYAESMPLWGLAGYPVMAPPPPATDVKLRGVDAHLRSARELIGYSVEANDGSVGKVTDLLIDGRTWMIREIVVECGHWYAGEKAVVSTDKITRIDYEQGTVEVDSTKQAFAEASEPHSTPIPRADESSLAEESSAILAYRIGIIQTTIQKARNIPADTRAELLTLVAGLKSELATLSETHQEEALSITRFSDASAHEASRSRKNPQLAETALKGLRVSIRGLEDSHPVLSGTVNSFATALSSMCI